MATCKDCLHYEACGGMFEVIGFVGNGIMDNADKLCDKFKDKSRFVELPCRRGDVVYCIRYDIRKRPFIKTLTVCSITLWEPGQWTIFTTKEDMLGKTVFLTREAAEEALREREKEHE